MSVVNLSPTLSDVLDIEYPGPPAWSDDGEFLATLVHVDDDQVLLIATPDGDAEWHVHPAGGVTEFAWSPTDPRLVAATDDGEVLVVDPTERTTRRLTSAPGGDAALTWGPDGERIACYRDGVPWVVHVDEPDAEGFDVPERGSFLGEARMFAWTDEGDALAYRFVDRDAKQLGVIDLDDGSLAWRTRTPRSSHTPAWIADGRLLFERNGEKGTVRQLIVADTEHGEETICYEERDEERGTASRGAPSVSPDGTRFAVALPDDGWEHLYLFDPGRGERRQLTRGRFEDKGLAGSSPQWVDDRTLVFASNRNGLTHRGLFAFDTEIGETRTIVDSDGTNVHPAPSPDGTRIAYVHADREVSPEIRVSSIADDGEEPICVTRSTVRDWETPPIEPEPVQFEGPDGLEIDGFVLDPRDHPAVDDDATDLPGVVYVHGGPMRQMRDGWHPGRSYGIAYAVQQYLAARGYAGILVNYRGGIGYGKEFRQAIAGSRGHEEIEDCVRAGEFLGEQPYVDEDSIAIWGLSYGGYATLQSLGTHPDAFAVGVNLAGLADLANYREWACDTKSPEEASAQTVTLGGAPDEAPEAWAEASPMTHMERYESPLYNFHGTADAYVNVDQLDIVVDRLLELDKEFEAEYYPDENHVFRKRSVWRRTIEKMESAFDEHLR